MSFNLNKIIRNNIKDLIPYSSARDEYTGKGAIYLDANENPYNAPYNRYPDPRQRDLKKGIADFFSVEPDFVFLGNGSDEAIDLLFRAFCVPGKDNVLSMSPSYGMYEVAANINDVEIRKVLLNDDFTLNYKEVLNQSDNRSKLIFLCSPNNPTSNLIKNESVFYLLDNFDGLVIVDEAYIDFADTDGMLPFVSEFKNLVVLRTFSKAWGLAGIRLGMAFADPGIINVLNKIKYPYNVNALTQQFASKFLNKKELRNKWIREIIRQRKWLSDELSQLNICEKIYPSDANFILVKVKNALALYNFLKEQKMIIRDRSRVQLCENCLRITVGKPTENKKLIERIKEYSG